MEYYCQNVNYFHYSDKYPHLGCIFTTIQLLYPSIISFQRLKLYNKQNRDSNPNHLSKLNNNNESSSKNFRQKMHIIVSILVSFSHQRKLVIFHWSLMNPKYPMVIRTLLSILANLNNTIIAFFSGFQFLQSSLQAN